MTEDTENLVLQLLRDIRADIVRLDKKIDDVSAEFGAGLHSLRADVASDLMNSEKRVGEQIVGLRRAVMEYHSSAIGHGVLIGELDDRLRRVEQHLNLPSESP